VNVSRDQVHSLINHKNYTVASRSLEKGRMQDDLNIREEMLDS